MISKGTKAVRYLVLFSLVAQLYADVGPISHNTITAEKTEVKVGVILDMGSWTGKTIHSCISMAISDFYASNIEYRTRIVLHTRDSRGETMHAISAALDLIENVKVQTIIGPETYLEAKFLAILGDKAKVPVFPLCSIPSPFGEYPFLVQMKQDETSQFKGIASILKLFKWRTINIIYEGNDNGRDILQLLVHSLQEANIHIAYSSAISPFSADDQIINKLHKIMTMQPTINIVHMSPSLASRLFASAKMLGMMKEGYAWIATDKTINQLHTLDPEVIESLQGVLGLKAYIPSSGKLHSFTSRWRKEFFVNYSTMEPGELDMLGIWAYDTIWIIAESVERVSIEFSHARNQSTGSSSPDYTYVAVSHHIGTRLLNEILGTKFTGLSGEFKILNGKLYSDQSYVIVNVIGKGERRVGFWTPEDGLVKEIQPSVTRNHPSKRRGLETVIWPGGSSVAAKGRLMLTSGRKLRIGVTNNQGFKELLSGYHDAQINAMSSVGFCIDVFDAAIQLLDYEVRYEFIPFFDANGNNFGSYTDLIDQVYLEKFDGAVGDITITANRSLYVDFTLPYTDLGVGTITRRKTNDIWVFSKPLHVNLWITSAAFFVLLGSVVWALEHPNNEEFQGSVAQQIGTIFWFGFSTLVYAHREKLKSNLSKFVVIIWLFVVLILTSSYTATLSSMLTLQQIQLASAGEYIGIPSNSYLGGVIANNLNFKDDRLRQYSSAQEYADALSRGSKRGGVAAIIDEIPYIKIFLAKYGGDYAMVASSSATNGFGFAFQKGSPLVSDMSRAIMKLREEGRLATMEKTWFKSRSSFMPDDTAATPNILNLDSFGGLFLISSISFIVALLLHLIFIFSMRLQANDFFIKLLDGGKLAFLLRFFSPRNGTVIELVNVR